MPHSAGHPYFQNNRKRCNLMADILIQGLTQNNLKHVSFHIPKEKITVFTGVSGSGKSSIVFDTIAAESQRQMNSTYPAFVRSRLPKYPKPAVERIDNLTASVVVDQSPPGRECPFNSRNHQRTVLQSAAAVFKGRKALCRYGILLFF